MSEYSESDDFTLIKSKRKIEGMKKSNKISPLVSYRESLTVREKGDQIMGKIPSEETHKNRKK